MIQTDETHTYIGFENEFSILANIDERKSIHSQRMTKINKIKNIINENNTVQCSPLKKLIFFLVFNA